MARLPRIDLAGFHHVINRGVERREIFIDKEGYDLFLTFLSQRCAMYEVDVHSYCLMSNHNFQPKPESITRWLLLTRLTILLRLDLTIHLRHLLRVQLHRGLFSARFARLCAEECVNALPVCLKRAPALC